MIRFLVFIASRLLLWGALALLQQGIVRAEFVHPSVPLNLTGLQALRAKVLAGEQPWRAGYEAMAADWRSAIDYSPRGAEAVVTRNPNSANLAGKWRPDMIAAYNQARMWWFTGNETYAQKARDILVDWANVQTSFGGTEANLDLGDYAYRFVGAAEILRSTWPGWTQDDTDKVKALFLNVYWPPLGLSGNVLGPANKGSLSLVAGAHIAIFCDDQARFDRVLYHLRHTASTGFVNTLSNGEHGETGRDEGHSYNHIFALSEIANLLWNQGIDAFSYADNRLLAMGEYYARENLLETTKFVPMGTTDEYYTNNWSVPNSVGFVGTASAFNILKSAYVLRKGMSAPFMERKLLGQPTSDMDAFMWLLPSDTSTATPLAAAVRPSAGPVGAGALTSRDIGTATPVGGSSYDADTGVWTVRGSGTEIWTHSANSFHFAHRTVTGDSTIIAKVESIGNTHPNAKAGIMIRSDLNNTPGSMIWIALRPVQSGVSYSLIEGYMHGWTNAYGGSNWETFPRNGAGEKSVPQLPYWLKLERVGDMIWAYASQDGTSWATLLQGEFKNMPSTAYVGLAVCAITNGTLNTSTFSHVSVTGAAGGKVVLPEAPEALHASPGEQVPLRWTESFGATSYTVKRATTGGGPYATIATGVPSASYVDESAAPDTTYYYTVSGVNAAGEGSASAEEAVTARKDCVYLSTGGTASASGGTAGNAFDLNCASKWSVGAATGMLQYDFGAGETRIVTAYDIVTTNGNYTANPKDWQFQGSNGGGVWTTLDTRSDEDLTTVYYHPRRFHITNADAYRYYRLNITANNGATSTLELSEFRLLGPADALPSAPSGLVASAASMSRIDLSWTASAEATSYQVWRAPAAVGPFTLVASGIAATTYADQTLPPATTFHYVVRAVSVHGVSADSSSVNATTASFVGTAIGIDFQGGGSSNGTPSLMGPAESAGVIALGNWNSFAGASGSSSALKDCTGAPTAAAVSWSANNLWSMPITDSAGDARMMKGYLDTSNTSTTTVTVTGIPAAFTAGGYSVYVYCDGDNGTSAKTGVYALSTGASRNAIDPASTNFSGAYAQAGNYVLFTGLTGSSFTLSAQGRQTDSGPRAPINGIQIVAMAPPAPEMVTATGGAAKITLGWSASPGATGYVVRRAASYSGPYSIIANGVVANDHADSALGAGEPWFYTVSAIGFAGESAPSAPVFAVTYTGVQAWRFAYFGSTADSGSAADSFDPDGDGLTNAQEYIAGTVPIDGSSAFRITSIEVVGVDVLLRFPSVAGKIYLVEYSDTLAADSWIILQDGIGGDGGEVTVIDTGGATHARRFYRAVVE